MAETTKVATDVTVTLDPLLGGGYRASDPLHGVQTTGRTDFDALRRLHQWLEQRGLANQSTVYLIRRLSKPGPSRDEHTYSLRPAEFALTQGRR